FKAFLPLALDAKHPFWTADEEPMPNLKGRAVPVPDGKKVLGRSPSGHAWMLNAGHNMTWQGRAFCDKYARFAYSSVFGFSTSLDACSPAAMAPDSSLIVSIDAKQWFGRRETDHYRSGRNWVESAWSPCPGVRVVTHLILTDEGHRRHHQIETEHEIEYVEGGFAMPRPDEILGCQELNPAEGFHSRCGAGFAEVRNESLYSIIRDCRGEQDREGQLLEPWANTHLLYPATVIPILKGRLNPGTHTLECEVISDRINV
ncbi:MAG: hypothetical protein AB3N33_06915, partial [Puniceicoccaceae bacterium]